MEAGQDNSGWQRWQGWEAGPAGAHRAPSRLVLPRHSVSPLGRRRPRSRLLIALETSQRGFRKVRVISQKRGQHSQESRPEALGDTPQPALGHRDTEQALRIPRLNLPPAGKSPTQGPGLRARSRP